MKNKVKAGEIFLTLLMFGWIMAALLGGGFLLGFVELPAGTLPYIGGGLVAYVLVGFMVITHLCVKFMLKKG